MEKLSDTASTSGDETASLEEKLKKQQQDAQMAKLREKHMKNPKTYTQLQQSARKYILSMRFVHPSRKVALRQTLDKLQHSISAATRRGLVERLRNISLQLGMKLVDDGQVLFMESEMFYIELRLDEAGTLIDVQIHHDCKPMPCIELLNSIKKMDFHDFKIQIEDYLEVYKFCAPTDIKYQVLHAMQAMETDILKMFEQQNLSGNIFEKMAKSSLGLVLKRHGGHLMKLIYLSPEICAERAKMSRNKTEPSLVQLFRSKSTFTAKLSIEESSLASTVTFTKDTATEPLSLKNSQLFPANFVLRLNKLMPVNYSALLDLNLLAVANEFVPTNGDNNVNAIAKKPLVMGSIMSLLVQTVMNDSNIEISPNKGFYVRFYKYTHCYYLVDKKSLKAITISSLAFSEKSQVPKIIRFLKEQALYYSLLSSCIGKNGVPFDGMDDVEVVEVYAVSFDQISIELLYPYDNSLTTVDFKLSDGKIDCVIFSLEHDFNHLSEVLSRTVQKVHSIPYTVYKLLRLWQKEQKVKEFGKIILDTATDETASTGKGLVDEVSEKQMDTANPTKTVDLSGPETFSSINSMKIDVEAKSLAESFAVATSAAAALAKIKNLKIVIEPNVETTNSGDSEQKLPQNTTTNVVTTSESKSDSEKKLVIVTSNCTTENSDFENVYDDISLTKQLPRNDD